MKPVTLCLAQKDGKILLAMKKRGFGVGKWNGCGGKVEAGETVETAALREMREEVGLIAAPTDIKAMGEIEFHFTDKPEWNQKMHVFLVTNWQGDPQESEEMKPQWFEPQEIPFHAMWPDDQHWLPVVLAGKKVTGKFYFVNEGAQIDRFELREV